MHNIFFEVLHLQKQKMLFEAASLRGQKGGRGRFLVLIPLLLTQGTQGSTNPNVPDKQVFIAVAGGRALLQVEDCPKESVEKLRGEVEDEYSLSPFSISSQAGSAIFSLFLRAGCKSNPGRPAVRPGQADLLLLPLEDQQLHRQLYRRHQHHYL